MQFRLNADSPLDDASLAGAGVYAEASRKRAHRKNGDADGGSFSQCARSSLVRLPALAISTGTETASLQSAHATLGTRRNGLLRVSRGGSFCCVFVGACECVYTGGVSFILRCVTLLLLITGLVSPVAELFDRWDPPGLGNDTELPVFALVLLLSLVLLVCRLMAFVANTVTLVLELLMARSAHAVRLGCFARFWALPPSVLCTGSPPLRI